MADRAGIEIQVGQIRSIGLDVVVERVKKHYVMGIITAHLGPGLTIPPHTPEPQVLPGVWKLSPYAKESASGVKLIGIQAELFPQDFKRVDGSIRRWRFKLVINKASVGFFEVEGVAIVSNGYITRTEELMKFFDELPIVLEIGLVPGEVRESSDNCLVLTLPAIGEA